MTQPDNSTTDTDRINWLIEHQAWLIELDDGRSIDASRGDLRRAIDAAMDRWPEVPVDEKDATDV